MRRNDFSAKGGFLPMDAGKCGIDAVGHTLE